jgi:nucleoside-diphosphate-sugar epimerase
MRFDLAVNQMVARAVKKGKIFIFEGGRQWRPFVHVEDAARACVVCLEAPADKVRGGVFNVGRDDNNFQIAELAHLVVKSGRFWSLRPNTASRTGFNRCAGCSMRVSLMIRKRTSISM